MLWLLSRLAPITCVVALLAAAAGAADWPQWRGPARDGVWRETNQITRFPAPQIAIKWRAPVAAGYSGPTVADGRVFVSDRIEEPSEQERIHCFDAETGAVRWVHAYPVDYREVSYKAGPRGSVLAEGDFVYSLGATGQVVCLSTADGAVAWQRDLNREYKIRMPDWGLAASPLMEGDALILQISGSDGACIVALDKRTGRERWRALEDRASYSAPIVIDQAGTRVLVCWTADRVVGLDPATGAEHWTADFPASKWPIATATPVLDGDRLFLSSAIDGSLMLKLHSDRLAVEKVWQRKGQNEVSTDALHSLIATPYIEGDHIYGVCISGELRCLDARTGDRVWESQEAVPKAKWAAAHLIRGHDRVWIFNERGELIIAQLSPEGYREVSRAQLIRPTTAQLPMRGGVCWAHPAFANGHIFARNDEEIVCADLRANR
jgi:outer membrane protein assembly factor BamB